jgi:hypothetical protein
MLIFILVAFVAVFISGIILGAISSACAGLRAEMLADARYTAAQRRGGSA